MYTKRKRSLRKSPVNTLAGLRKRKSVFKRHWEALARVTSTKWGLHLPQREAITQLSIKKISPEESRVHLRNFSNTVE